MMVQLVFNITVQHILAAAFPVSMCTTDMQGSCISVVHACSSCLHVGVSVCASGIDVVRRLTP